MTKMLVGAAAVAVLCALPAGAATKKSDGDSDLTAQRRSARVYVYPRRGPGPNSVRQCRSWLAQEYRLSGTVIVPRMQCWWE